MADEVPGGESTTSSSYSPITKLPPELLAQIFEHCSSVESYSPVRLSHVSTFWRSTAITTPCLWHSVSIKFPTNRLRSTSARVGTWLARSGSIPLHISLVVKKWRERDNDSISFPLFHHLRSHSHHWGRLSLIMNNYTVARCVFQFFTSFPHHDMLSRVDLGIGLLPLDDSSPHLLPEEDEDERWSITSVLTCLMDTYAPRFTEFNFATAALPYDYALKNRVGFLQLRTLRFFERNTQIWDTGTSTILHLLDKCPALELFIFRGSTSSDRQGITSIPVHLPHLRELHIAQTVHQRVILAHLTTPALQILRLSCLNRPEIFIDDSYTPDPSENSEEPTEWSQSPYTDLLTGAGIRSLISRSAPPIRVLDMDFADARSPKDFVWVFERLPTLESFRIIGSDMSDKVLYALASANNNGKWLCPRLTSLDFSRCDVITGGGVVALAKSRNPWEDHIDGKSAKNISVGLSRPSRLQKFIVEACARVDCESVAVMQYILGAVDFAVEVVPT